MLQPRQHPRPCSSGRHASCTAPRSVRVSVRRGRAANSRSTPSQEWARSWHIEKGPKGDLDWHIELTQSAKTDSLECVVVEIPDPKYGAVFDTARKDFLNLLGNSKPNKKKWLVPRITVVGPALFDAQHRGAKDSGNPPTGHGNCNSSDSALWEIHPVYR